MSDALRNKSSAVGFMVSYPSIMTLNPGEVAWRTVTVWPWCGKLPNSSVIKAFTVSSITDSLEVGGSPVPPRGMIEATKMIRLHGSRLDWSVLVTNAEAC